MRAALAFLDEHAAMSRKGVDGVTAIRTAGLAAAVFDHRTSRAGDPQLHSHALVVNKLRCTDGGWRSIDGHEIYHHKKAAGALYQAALRAELTRRLGVGFDPVNAARSGRDRRCPDRAGRLGPSGPGRSTPTPTPTLDRFADDLGRDLTAAERATVVKTSVLKTRPAKPHLAEGVLQDRWRAEAARAGLDAGPAGPRRAVHRMAGRANRPRQAGRPATSMRR